ncbi:hypothetical protein HO133_003613 [Letharia lupina]|uniref:Uncharacterized protein n=1 Tax=Letharia lupina TaxID=560253 RepID=A0A8H6CAK8_9LECA|nr:uncharacterized protein HO133_003613 [Letharia lupina]KAF6219788.1 hypothetical protein HO133_003613 [Letharia lupina]
MPWKNAFKPSNSFGRTRPATAHASSRQTQPLFLRTLQKKLPSNTSGPRSNPASTPNHPRFSDVLEIDSTLQPNSYPDASDDENLSDSASRDGNGISPDFGSENDEAFDEDDARDTRDFRGCTRSIGKEDSDAAYWAHCSGRQDIFSSGGT